MSLLDAVLVLVLVHPSSSAAAKSEPPTCQSELAEASPWIFPVDAPVTPPEELAELPTVVSPAIIECEPAVFPSSGLDVVTELQGSLILQAIVDEVGSVERFRIVHRPELSIDYSKPLAEALAGWRFDLHRVEGSARRFCALFTVRKPMGSRSTECGQPHDGSATEPRHEN